MWRLKILLFLCGFYLSFSKKNIGKWDKVEYHYVILSTVKCWFACHRFIHAWPMKRCVLARRQPVRAICEWTGFCKLFKTLVHKLWVWFQKNLMGMFKTGAQAVSLISKELKRHVEDMVHKLWVWFLKNLMGVGVAQLVEHNTQCTSAARVFLFSFSQNEFSVQMLAVFIQPPNAVTCISSVQN